MESMQNVVGREDPVGQLAIYVGLAVAGWCVVALLAGLLIGRFLRGAREVAEAKAQSPRRQQRDRVLVEQVPESYAVGNLAAGEFVMSAAEQDELGISPAARVLQRDR
jgi:hypothetical protein